ncbi:MAG: hypothetical protein ACSHX0_03145 [Akkermansiaceae bacterium]
MPESKTIQIDEITSPKDQGGGAKNPRNQGSKKQQQKPHSRKTPSPGVGLGWKALLTLKVTQWFLRIKNKSYAKWVIVPAVILAILLIIPVAALAILWFIIKSIFAPVRTQR